MQIHNVEQQTPEWHALRAGKMTASHAKTIQANGAGLKTYCYKTVAKLYSEPEEQYVSDAMLRGIELEPVARELYELETGDTIEEVGFVTMDDYVGCSPDGLHPDYGLEIKCHNNAKHFRTMIERDVKGLEKGYWCQMQMCMLVCERDLWKYVAFNPNFVQSLVVIDVKADEKAQAKLLAGFETGRELIDEIKNKYHKQL